MKPRVSQWQKSLGRIPTYRFHTDHYQSRRPPFFCDGGLRLVPGVNLYRLCCSITSHCTLVRLYTSICRRSLAYFVLLGLKPLRSSSSSHKEPPHLTNYGPLRGGICLCNRVSVARESRSPGSLIVLQYSMSISGRLISSR